jgi:hypothetical protein
MDSFSPLTTSNLNIHNLEVYTANLVIQGNASGPFRRATDLVNRKDRDYMMLQEARLTPIGRQPNPNVLTTPLMVARQHTHLVALGPQPEPEHTTSGLGQVRESGVRKVAYPCYMFTEVYVVVGQCHLVEGSTLENLLAVSELFVPITNVTLYINSLPNAPLQRDLVIINKEKIQAMYLIPTPTSASGTNNTATQKLEEPPRQPTSPNLNESQSNPPTASSLRERISSQLKDRS